MKSQNYEDMCLGILTSQPVSVSASQQAVSSLKNACIFEKRVELSRHAESRGLPRGSFMLHCPYEVIFMTTHSTGSTAEPIAAVATGAVRSAIGIVRLSGPGVIDAVSRLFVPARGGSLADAPDRALVYGTLYDASGAAIDQALDHMEMSQVFGGSKIVKQ